MRLCYEKKLWKTCHNGHDLESFVRVCISTIGDCHVGMYPGTCYRWERVYDFKATVFEYKTVTCDLNSYYNALTVLILSNSCPTSCRARTSMPPLASGRYKPSPCIAHFCSNFGISHDASGRKRHFEKASYVSGLSRIEAISIRHTYCSTVPSPSTDLRLPLLRGTLADAARNFLLSE